jgi:hypothetical protein
MKKETVKTTQVASQERLNELVDTIANNLVDFIIEQDYRGTDPQLVKDLYELFEDEGEQELLDWLQESNPEILFKEILFKFARNVEAAVNNHPRFKEMYPEGVYTSKEEHGMDNYGEMVANIPLLDRGPRAKEVAEHLLGVDEYPDWDVFWLDTSKGALAEAIMYCCSSFGGPLMGNFGDEGWGEYEKTLEKEVRAFGWQFIEDILDVIRNNELFPGKDVYLYGEGDEFCVDDSIHFD